MGLIFIDGFDNYGPTGENSPSISTLLGQEWTSVTGITYSTIAGLNGTGNALNITAGGFSTPVLSKTLAASVGTIIGGFRFQSDCAQQNGIRFLDTGTVQCAIGIGSFGPILYSGNFATAIKTSTVTISASSTHYVEWNITIGTAGAYNVYLDGVSVLSGTGNTRAGTVNNTINQIAIVVNTPNNNPGSTFQIDDLYLFDTTGSVNIAPLQNNPRIITRYPTSDSQTQWTNNGNVLVPAGITPTGVSNTTTSNTVPPGANELGLLKITPSVTCTLNSIGVLFGATSAGANNKGVLYSDSGGSPNTLVATGTQVTGTTAGTAATLPFAVGQSLTGGTSYWIGYITDTAVNANQYDNTTNLGQKKANTYASGAPAGPLSGMTTGQPTWEIWGNATGATTNWESVATNPAPGAGPSADNSSILSTTVNNEDLYGWPALPGSVATVSGIGVKGNAKRSDTVTAHTIDLRLKSTNDSAGSQAGQTVSSATTYAWFGSYFDQDPNGPTGWTPTSANAATAGPKLAS